MPRAKRMPRGMREPLSESFKDYLLYGIDPEPHRHIKDSFKCFIAEGTDKMRQIWDTHKEVILEDWIMEHPGSRPAGWWLYDAPRDIEAMKQWTDRSLPKPRQQTGGKGKKCNFAPCFVLGVFEYWDFIDRDDPPTFESQASYLKRHGLLTKQEAEALNVGDYAPESIEEIFDIEEGAYERH